MLLLGCAVVCLLCVCVCVCVCVRLLARLPVLLLSTVCHLPCRVKLQAQTKQMHTGATAHYVVDLERVVGDHEATTSNGGGRRRWWWWRDSTRAGHRHSRATGVGPARRVQHRPPRGLEIPRQVWMSVGSFAVGSKTNAKHVCMCVWQH